MFAPADFFSTIPESFAQIIADCQFVWEILPRIKMITAALVGDKQTILGDLSPDAYLSDRPIYIAEGARIEPGAYLLGPAYIGPGVVVRHGAYVRENVILLDHALLGHASEAKNTLFFPHAHAPHFNYVGDSILGAHANLGAGTKLSNLAMVSEKDPQTGKRPTLQFALDGQQYDLGVAKMGAILGDHAQTGCNSVLNPGVLVGRHSLVYPNMSLRKGWYPPHTVIKLRQQIESVKRQ